MTEQEAAVRWLEQHYDRTLELCTTEDEHPEWGRYVHFCSRSTRGSVGRLMFTIKDQNG